MPRDIGKYQTQITQFVDELCRIYYKHSQPEDRRDITSEVTLIAHQNRDKLKNKSESDFIAWLHEVARNVIRNWSRREGTAARHSLGSLDEEESEQRQADQVQSDLPEPDADVLFQERLQVIRQAISELPLNHQQVIWLFYVEELPEKRIAKRLGIQKGTVKSRLHHARKHLATLLEPYFGDE